MTAISIRERITVYGLMVQEKPPSAGAEPPTAETFYLLAENGDRLLAENGDLLLWEHP